MKIQKLLVFQWLCLSKRADIRGEVHNSLLVLRFIKNQNSYALWKCKCLKCRKAVFVTYSNIVSGNTKSCKSCGNSKLNKEHDANIKELYEVEFYTIVEIAKTYDVGRTTIRNSLLRTDTTIRRKGRRS